MAGDATYGARQNKRLTELTGYTAPRQMLHARKLGFMHPRKKEKMTFEARWPEDFQAALTALRLLKAEDFQKPPGKILRKIER